MAEFISILRANPLNSMLFGLVTATVVKGSLLLLLTFTVVLAARRLAAKQKHIIWFVVIVFLILTPICWLTLPPLGLNVAIPAYQSETIELMTAPLNSLDRYIEQVVLSDDLALKYDLFSTKGFLLHRAPWPSIMLGVWSVGIGVFFLRLFVGRRAINRFIRGARKCSDQRSRAILEKLMDIFKLNQKIDLMHSRLCNIPFAFGFAKPIVMLPSKMRDWPDERIEAVLRHELAHVKRRDCLSQFIARLICALFWFIPMVWIAYRRMQVEQEKSCDVYAMSSGIRGSEYAGDIIHLVRGSGGAVALPGLYNTLAKKNIIKERIKTIISFNPQKLSSRLNRLIILPVLFLCLLIPIIGVSFTTSPLVNDGVWINAEYSGSSAFSEWQKINQSPNGTWRGFRTVATTSVESAGSRTIVEKWSDLDGNIWYKLTNAQLAQPAGLANELHRVSSSGDTWEHVSKPAHLGWPTEIDPKDPEYRIYYRQKEN